MTQAQIKTVQCISPVGLHRMAYKEWGDPHNPRVLICVHGVTRVSDDFDSLARLCARIIVWSALMWWGAADRKGCATRSYYQIPQYVSDMVTLIARVTANAGVETVDWFGTSMGGLIGMGLASLPDNPIRKLVLNDVGPSLDLAQLWRVSVITSARRSVLQTFDEAANFIREISLTFGPHTDEEWRKLASDVLRQDKEGFWIRHYDLGLAVPFKASTPESMKDAEKMLWLAYDAISCPTLLVRGAESDLLSHATAQAMTQRGPRAQLIELPGVGHAPTFKHADQIAIAKDFLLK